MSSDPLRTAVWRKLVLQPLVWAAALLGTAIPWYLSGHGLDFVPYLLVLVGGALCGMTFVNATLSMKRTGLGAVIHFVVAVVVGGAMWWLVFRGNTILDDSPGALKSAVLLVQMAGIPAVGWMWLGIISRLSSLASKPSTKDPERVAPVWEEQPTGTLVHFAAITMPLRTLIVIMVATIAAAGSLTALALIAAEYYLGIVSVRFTLIVAGALVALPAYLFIKARFSRRTVPCTAAFTQTQLLVTTGTEQHVFRYSQIEKLLWRCTSDYARIEVHTQDSTLTLITGIAKAPRTVLGQLPELSRSTVRSLNEGGLAKKRTKRPGLTEFCRVPSTIPGSKDLLRP
ncbi:hypothetical protein [Arthrobacter alpinus]|uniref:hypothetical protein n=1 Tax=Arthrobacter alpinus TaxID=656366 RepID=UPI0012FEF2C1|nr:hypothetical protein [Arthrobacter alpinus]